MPVLAHGFRNLGIAITGQIHQMAVIAQREEIDELGTPWLLAHECKSIMIRQCIESTRFTCIGAAGKGNLDAGWWWQVSEMVGRDMESGVLKQRHGEVLRKWHNGRKCYHDMVTFL